MARCVDLMAAAPEFDSHQGGVVLLDEGNGVPLAIVDAREITAFLTAATSAIIRPPADGSPSSSLPGSNSG